jgi:hypothetical protein
MVFLPMPGIRQKAINQMNFSEAEKSCHRNLRIRRLMRETTTLLA